MKEQLKDIIDFTTPLGVLDTILISTPNGKKPSKAEAFDEAGSVVLKAESIKPIPEFKNEFALTRLNILKGYLGFANFNTDGANIEIIYDERDGKEVPVEILFEDEKGKTKSSARFKDARFARQPAFAGKFKNTAELEISKNDIIEFEKLSKMFAGNYPYFSTKVKDGDLYFTLGGSKSSDDNAEVFIKEIDGSVNSDCYYPISLFSNIVKLAGNNNVLISFIDNGTMCITIESEYFVYNYYVISRIPEDN